MPKSDSSEGFGFGPGGKPAKKDLKLGIFDQGGDEDYAPAPPSPTDGDGDAYLNDDSDNMGGDEGVHPSAMGDDEDFSSSDEGSPMDDIASTGLSDYMRKITERSRDRFKNPLSEKPSKEPTAKRSKSKEQGIPGGDTQPLVVTAMGKNQVVQVSTKYDLNDPDVVKDLQDYHSLKIAANEMKESGEWQERMKAVKEAQLEGIRAGQEMATKKQAGESQRKLTLRDGLPALLQKKYDEAIEDKDIETIAMLEDRARLNFEMESVKQENENIRMEQNAERSNRVVTRELVKIKKLAPGLPGDPSDDPEAFIKGLIKPGEYLHYLLTERNLDSNFVMSPSFPHEEFLTAYQREHGKPVLKKSDGSRKPFNPAGTETAEAKQARLRNAAKARDRLEGGSQGSAMGGSNDEHLARYHNASLIEKRRMESQIPGIKDEHQKWFRKMELSGKVSPFGINYRERKDVF